MKVDTQEFHQSPGFLILPQIPAEYRSLVCPGYLHLLLFPIIRHILCCSRRLPLRQTICFNNPFRHRPISDASRIFLMFFILTSYGDFLPGLKVPVCLMMRYPSPQANWLICWSTHCGYLRKQVLLPESDILTSVWVSTKGANQPSISIFECIRQMKRTFSAPS